MQAAEKNILDLLDDLQARFREQRQAGITNELPGNIPGFAVISEDAAIGQRNPRWGKFHCLFHRRPHVDTLLSIRYICSYAEKARPAWAAAPIAERSKVLLKAAGLIMARQQEPAELETMEHGSPIRKTMNFDIPLCAEQLEYFAGVARAMTGDTLPVGPWYLSTTVHEPLGIIVSGICVFFIENSTVSDVLV